MIVEESNEQNMINGNGERSSLEDQVYKRIKLAILSKELRPGEKVSHAEWAERLNFSRTPVRDALKRLENEGLIVRETERIWHVYTLTLEDVFMIFDARIAVDGRIAYLAAQNITAEQIEELKTLLARMDQTRIDNSYDAFLEENKKFHSFLNNVCNNSYLIKANLLLNEKTSRLYPKGINIDHRLEKGFKENLLIAQALIDRDPTKAQHHQVQHIISYRDHLIKVIKEMVIPYTGPEF
jgi:DNA-binding GntR family transcriptional regulator